MKYNGIVIADIHVGAMNLDRLHEEYLNLLINKIHDIKKLDFLIVAGDFFDRKFYLNDKESTMAYLMLRELVEACKLKNTALRIVYGTESHECNQYDILSLLKIYDNIKVIKTVTEEELLPDLNVLYLPEEHMINQQEYYKDFFNNTKKYNYIFGHGVIREIMSDVVVHMENKSDSKRKKVPIFKSSDLISICKGQTFFGHYHINNDIDNKVFYVGSFSRWKFGEEGRKGYYMLKCDTDKNTYKATFIENEMALRYNTISYGYNDKIFNNDKELVDTLNHVDDLVNSDSFDNLRFVFNIPNDIENPEATINYLKERYKYNDKIKLEITHGYIEEKRKQQKEQLQKDNEIYNFIFDKELPLVDKVSKFIILKYNRNIDECSIDNYLHNSLNDIISFE